MKVKRKIIQIDEERCDGCGQCAIACAEGAIDIVDGKAKVISDNLCDGLGACIGDCPQGALTIIERTADEFDEDAVEKHLAQRKKSSEPDAALPCGCPSTQLQEFTTPSACQKSNAPAALESERSALTHWPVQIRLVPPTAPFLKNADLLVTADCVPLAYPSIHRDFMTGRVVMMGCPKFDDTKMYIEKFVDVLNTADIKSLTCLIMEVPCCSGLPHILKKAKEISGKGIPLEVVVISNRGEIVKRMTN